MNDQPLGERVRALEVSLKQHLADCRRGQNRAFTVSLAIFVAMLGVLVKLYWPG